jgi:4-hydroxythreonine-4-phosphate dehydrogenase
MTDALPRLAVAIGDPAGIGPEIVLKALASGALGALCRPLVIGDIELLKREDRRLGTGLALARTDAATSGEIPVVDPGGTELAAIVPGRISAASGRALIRYARQAIELALTGRVDAVLAAPHTEAAVRAAGIPFAGYPLLLGEVTGTPRDDVFLMLVSDELRIVNVTLHLPLRGALDLLTEARIVSAGRAAAAALGPRIRLGVCGINPHAGEDGLFGSEDETIVKPAVARLRAEGIAAEGPFGADALFATRRYDAYLAMYHDQGHIPIKLLAFGRSAGVAIGTPVLFSTVAHGSALDIAGQGKADPGALVTAARFLAATAAARRRE